MLYTRPADIMSLYQAHRELHIRGGLGALAEQFAVAMAGVPVTQHEIGTRLIDGQVHDGALVHGVIVHVAAVSAHRPRVDCLSMGRSDPDAAQRRMRGELELDPLAERPGCRDCPAPAVQIPAQRVTPARLQPLVAAGCWEKSLDRGRFQRIGRNPDSIPAPIAIEPNPVETHDECVARLRAFNIEGSSEHVVPIQNQFAHFIAAAGIKALGDHRIPRLHPRDWWMRSRKRCVVVIRRDVARFTLQRRARQIDCAHCSKQLLH